jgi:hypothetical protein
VSVDLAFGLVKIERELAHIEVLDHVVASLPNLPRQRAGKKKTVV